jgi:AcrR family transcriptional regulator
MQEQKVMRVKPKDVPTKGETTRLAIEDAAVELFTANGYHATSMRQIAEHSGIALGGIYNHFSSKDELFEGIIVDKHPYKKILPLVLEAQGDTAEDFLRNAMQIVITELGREPYYLKLMMIEFVEFNGGHVAAMLKQMIPTVLPVFEKVVKTRKDLRVVNPAMLMRSFFGMVVSYFITEMIISNSVISKLMPKNTMEVYVDIFLHGILKSE